jgi:hypothetical protein
VASLPGAWLAPAGNRPCPHRPSAAQWLQPSLQKLLRQQLVPKLLQATWRPLLLLPLLLLLLLLLLVLMLLQATCWLLLLLQLLPSAPSAAATAAVAAWQWLSPLSYAPPPHGRWPATGSAADMGIQHTCPFLD